MARVVDVRRVQTRVREPLVQVGELGRVISLGKTSYAMADDSTMG